MADANAIPVYIQNQAFVRNLAFEFKNKQRINSTNDAVQLLYKYKFYEQSNAWKLAIKLLEKPRRVDQYYPIIHAKSPATLFEMNDIFLTIMEELTTAH